MPFGQLLPKCDACCCSALIARTNCGKKGGIVPMCLDHGLSETMNTRDLVLKRGLKPYRYAFISPEHEAAIRTFFA